MKKTTNATRQSFHTGHLAKVLKVSVRTVQKWIDEGRLPGHRTVGTGERRVARADLIRFIHAYGFPPLEVPTGPEPGSIRRDMTSPAPLPLFDSPETDQA